MMATETLELYITRTNERALGVFVVSAEHVYRDCGGNPRKVYVSFVLEEFRGMWTLTQVGTASDRTQSDDDLAEGMSVGMVRERRRVEVTIEPAFRCADRPNEPGPEHAT